jgi:hypothetical protein
MMFSCKKLKQNIRNWVVLTGNKCDFVLNSGMDLSYSNEIPKQNIERS